MDHRHEDATLSIQPATAADYGLQLMAGTRGEIEEGQIEATLCQHDPDGDRWDGVQALTDRTDLVDGRWHHVAVAVKLRDEVRIYVDGQPQSVTLVTTSGAVQGDAPPGKALYA